MPHLKVLGENEAEVKNMIQNMCQNEYFQKVKELKGKGKNV